MTRFLVLGNLENRRVEFFREACRAVGLEAPVELAWSDFLADPELLASRMRAGMALRIESPGENFEVERRLVALGGREELLVEDPGRLRFHTEWYAGWCAALAQVSAHLPKGIPVMNPPQDIALMFDKERSQRRLAAAGVPVPALLGLAADADEVLRMMDDREIHRVFVKPCHSSSASGVVALQRNGPLVRAVTSVEMVCDGDETRLYNSLRLRTYTNEAEVRQLLDALGRERLLVEKWFPKAGHDGRTFDLRVLVIDGKASQVVARTSRSPITNLHLGNQRGDLTGIRAAMGEAAWDRALRTCERAAHCFPDCLYVAVDILIGSSFRAEAVAEVNAFGDLLPNLWHDGLNTYEAELSAFLRRPARGCREGGDSGSV